MPRRSAGHAEPEELDVARRVRPNLACKVAGSTPRRGVCAIAVADLVAVSYLGLVQGFNVGVDFAGALIVVVATNLALVIPSLPAGLGMFEAATIMSRRASLDAAVP